MSALKVIFFGNHTVGVQVLEALHVLGCLSGVVAHPEDPEDGIRYLSVYQYARKMGKPVIRASAKMPILGDFIDDIKPDLIWVTDYRYLLPAKIYTKAKLGAINVHPSLLPKYRGRASLNWAIMNGEKEVGLTAHFIDDGVDTGDIVKQISLKISDEDYIGDVLKRLYPAYQELVRDVIGMYESGTIFRQKQASGEGSIYPARKPEDGLIDFTNNAKKVLNFIRAISIPYPGAFLVHGEKKIIIWSAEMVQESFNDLGIHSKDNIKYLQCYDGVLKVTNYEEVPNV